MEVTLQLWSKDYSPVECNDPFTAQVSYDLWQRIMREDEGKRHFLRIHDWIVPCGQPVNYEGNHAFLPLWMIDSAGISGLGDEVEIEVLNEEAFPPATRIVLKVVDSAFYTSDIKEELEKALSAIGVIRKHTTLQIRVSSLGDFPVDLFIANTEPADVVLCDGEEVALEFEEPVDYFEPPVSVSPVTPEQKRPSTPIPSFENLPMVGSWISAGSGNVLGSSTIISDIPAWRLAVPHRPRS
jgi:hypothetical protein